MVSFLQFHHFPMRNIFLEEVYPQSRTEKYLCHQFFESEVFSTLIPAGNIKMRLVAVSLHDLTCKYLSSEIARYVKIEQAYGNEVLIFF